MIYVKQDIYMVFWWKNLDLDSNLYNLKKASKKLVKHYETDPNPNRPYSWTPPCVYDLPRIRKKSKKSPHLVFGPSDTPSSTRQRRTPIFSDGIVFSVVDLPGKRKKSKKVMVHWHVLGGLGARRIRGSKNQVSNFLLFFRTLGKSTAEESIPPKKSGFEAALVSQEGQWVHNKKYTYIYYVYVYLSIQYGNRNILIYTFS